jgi:hypothetical protein
MCKEKKPVYDPVHAHVPGIDELYAQQLRWELINGGDPIPKPELPKERIVFNFAGIKLVRYE